MADGTIKIDTSLDTGGLESGLSKLGSFAKTGAKVALSAIGGVATALIGLGGAAAKVGSDFEGEMSRVAAISGAAGEELEQLTEKAKEMGAKTKFSATESAKAMEYMAMAGWKTEDMLSGIEGIMNLAAAAGEDLALTSDIVTDALTAFGLSAQDSGHFADVLAAASSNANTNVSLMGETFKYVAPVAGALGFKAEDTAVAIGLMANSGIKGSQAGTALRSTLSRLAKPTGEVQGAISDLGVSLTDSAGNMKSLDEVMADLRKGFSGLTEAEKAQYAATIAGQEGMSGLLAIVGASDSDFNKLRDAIYGCDGATAQMAGTMMDNFKGSVTILKSSLEGLGVEIYGQMESPLKGAADAATAYVNRLNEAFKSGGLEDLIAEAGDIFAELVTKAAEQAPALIDTAVDLIEAFARGIIKNKSRLFDGAKEIVRAFAEGLAKLLPKSMQEPVKKAIDAITRSFESGGLKKASQTVATIFKNIGNAAGGLVKTVLPPLVKILDTLAEHLDLILPAAVAAYTALKTFQAITAATSGIKNMISIVKELWGVLAANPIGLAVSGVAGFVAGIAALSATVPDANAALKAHAEEMAEVARSTRDAKTAREEAADGINAEYDYYQRLWTELQKNVDQNGKVKEGYEERAAFITKELSEAVGIEIELNNGIIESYQDIQGEITKTIEKRRAEALLSAYRSDYEAAVKSRAEAQKSYTDALAANEEELKRNRELHEEYAKVCDSVSSSVGLTEEESRAYEESLSDLNRQIQESDEALRLTQQTLDDTSYTWEQNEQIIENWETASGAVESGSETMQQALLAMENGLLHHGKATEEALKKQRDDAWEHYQKYKSLVDVEGSGVTQKMVNETAAMFALTQAEWLKGTGATQEDIAYWNAIATGAIDGSYFPEHMERKAQEGIDRFGGRLKAGEGTASDAAAAVVDAAVSGAYAASASAKSVGYNFTDGLAAGIRETAAKVAGAASAAMAAGIAAANQTQKAHSPAKVLIQSGHYFGEGLEIGILDKKKAVARAGSDIMETAVGAADRQAALVRMRSGIDTVLSRLSWKAAVSGGFPAAPRKEESGREVYQTVNINQPVKSPVETAREIRKVGKELAFG